MKKYKFFLMGFLWLVAILFFIFCPAQKSQAQNTILADEQVEAISQLPSESESVVNLYLFYGEGCPHCKQEIEYLKKLKAQYGEKIKIMIFEIYFSSQNANLFQLIGNELGMSVAGVPLLFVEDQAIVGYGSDSSTGVKIQQTIDNCIKTNCESQVDELVKNSDASARIIEVSQPSSASDTDHSALTENDFQLDVPILGQVDLRSLSLPALTILLAAMDGFNPCAMWILIFLITMLINLEDKRRLFILGFTFIFVSSLVYFVFLSAWFNLFQVVGYVYWIRLIVGVVAIASGIMHLKDYYEKKTGCKVTSNQQRSKLMQRIKNVIQRESLLMSLVGISVLAISVNLIELVCSAGLPAIYTNILSLSDLSTVKYYLYLLLYTLIFMLDDMLIFTVAVKSFKVTGITSKYSKMSNLIGGIVILIIGILLLFRPQLLMFG